MTSPEPTTKQWLRSLVEPGQLLAWAITYYTKVCLEAVFRRGELLAPLLQTAKLRDEAFGRFWVDFSSNRPDASPATGTSAGTSTDTDTGVIQNSTDLIPSILAQAAGVVLDVGPGTGTQMPLLRGQAITAIYGAEPCAGLHAALRARAAEEGLAEKYTVMECGAAAAELAPELRRVGLVRSEGEGEGEAREIFDTIICVRVLCSVPEMERTVGELYALLRPGGKMLVVEHVVNPWRTAKGSMLARVMQVVYMALGWRWFIGNCCLDRDTERVLKSAARADGGWESVELDRWFGRSPLAYISGVLVKKEKKTA